MIEVSKFARRGYIVSSDMRVHHAPLVVTSNAHGELTITCVSDNLATCSESAPLVTDMPQS